MPKIKTYKPIFKESTFTVEEEMLIQQAKTAIAGLYMKWLNADPVKHNHFPMIVGREIFKNPNMKSFGSKLLK